MMSGKSVDRAIRGLFLVDSYLYVLLLHEVFRSTEVELFASDELNDIDVH